MGVVVTVIVLMVRGDDEQVATAPTTVAPATTAPPPPPPTTAPETTVETTTTVAETTTTEAETTTTTVETTTTVAETTTTVAGGGGPLPGDCPDGTVVPGGETLISSFDASVGITVCLAVAEPSFTQVRVSSDDDTTLTLFLDGEELAFDDDTFGLDPAITRPFEPGLYVLLVQTFSSFATGPVDFELSTASLPTTDDGCEPGLSLGVGGEVGGLVDNDLGRVACFVVEAPGVHEVRVEADSDTTLTVFRDGEEIDFDDDTYGLDPAITRAFEPGIYLLLVSNYAGGITDNFFRLTAD